MFTTFCSGQTVSRTFFLIMSEKQSRGRGRGIKPGGFADRLAKATADPEGNPADDDRQAMALKSESERKSRIACRLKGQEAEDGNQEWTQG